MIPELGSFAIILALCFAIIQALSPLCGMTLLQPRLEKTNAHTLLSQLSITAAIGQFLFLGFAMLCLIASFLLNDMTIVYVREHSHSLLPIIYRIGAAWGGHEGSLLLWCLILSVWTVAFLGLNLYLQKNKAKSLHTHSHWNDVGYNKKTITAILGIISAGFIIFLFFTSNPFRREFPSDLVIGDDLTPILQDPGLIFHPPMLYLGYVGFAIAFAFAISALLAGQFNRDWVRACRPWVILPWSFLSCGIVLGSWWAYRELGWGGWWFWDPVENASLLPWLSATALLHTLLVCEKRDVFKGWALLLAIVTFALSLLGTFLVRSGVLVSVHAFADDPTRGLFLLGYLALIIGGAFILYGYRIKYFFRAPNFALFSRETFLLINSVIMLAAVATILIGTLYPIILDALNLEKISVGEPYFNSVFTPIMLPVLLLMGLAPHVNWGHQTAVNLAKKLGVTALISLLIGTLSPLAFGFSFHLLASCSITLGIWIILATSQYALKIWRNQKYINLQHWSMIVAHTGIAIFVLGVAINKSYSEERQVKMQLHETVTLANYQFTLASLENTNDNNYQSITATFDVQKDHHRPMALTAQQRIYKSHEQSLSKPGILTNPWRDLYLALGSVLPDGSWSVRIYYKPFVRWIWAGGFLLLIGGLLSLLTYQKKRGNA